MGALQYRQVNRVGKKANHRARTTTAAAEEATIEGPTRPRIDNRQIPLKGVLGPRKWPYLSRCKSYGTVRGRSHRLHCWIFKYTVAKEYQRRQCQQKKQVAY